jgi:hypothetical protein
MRREEQTEQQLLGAYRAIHTFHETVSKGTLSTSPECVIVGNCDVCTLTSATMVIFLRESVVWNYVWQYIRYESG